jgi:hypothetical protein
MSPSIKILLGVIFFFARRPPRAARHRNLTGCRGDENAALLHRRQGDGYCRMLKVNGFTV